MAADSQPPEGLQAKIAPFGTDDVDAAVTALAHNAYLGEEGPLERDDLEEIVRIVFSNASARGRLLPSGGEVSTEVEWAVRRDHEGNGTHWVSEPFYRQEQAEALLATMNGGGDPVYVVSRHIQAGPWWSPVVPDNSETGKD